MSKENYTNHNFVTNYAYEIYREDGSLREKYEPEAKADCEGTFEVDIKGKDGNLKSHDEKPIRSFTYFITGDKNSAVTSYFPQLYPLGSDPLPSKLLCNQSNWSYDTTLGFGGQYACRGGIYIANRSGSAPFYTFSPWNGAYATDHNYTIVEVYPYLDENNESIKFSLSRTCTMSSPGSITSDKFIAISIGVDNGSSAAVADHFSETKTWLANEQIKITYNFSIPTSTNSTITKNLIHDLFANFIRTGKLKNKEGSEISIVRYTDSRSKSKKGLPSLDYVNGTLNNTNKGIVLGSSSSNVSWEDYSLNSEFSVNELQPQSSGNSDYLYGQYSGNTLYCMYARNFKNISDHDITIREAGVYSYATDTTYTVAQAGSFLLAHWLTGDVVVHPNETIRVYWKPTIVVE